MASLSTRTWACASKEEMKVKRKANFEFDQ
jgi:hypothetical protein